MTRTRATDDSSPQDDGEPEDDEVLLMDNLQSQDDPVDDRQDLQKPLTFVLDECPFGPGFLTVVKSMREGEVCEAWLNPTHGPGETTIMHSKKITAKSVGYAQRGAITVFFSARFCQREREVLIIPNANTGQGRRFRTRSGRERERACRKCKCSTSATLARLSRT